jgi:hypothetical protein
MFYACTKILEGKTFDNQEVSEYRAMMVLKTKYGSELTAQSPKHSISSFQMQF